MKITDAQLKIIKEIIEKKHKQLTVSMLGTSQFSAAELESLKKLGVDVSKKTSLLEAIYKHYGVKNASSIRSVEAMLQLGIEKLMADTTNRLELILRNSRPLIDASELGKVALSELQKESSIGKVKQLLRDASGVGERDWQRVALTEMSNAVGYASVERILEDQDGEADPNEIYVYRLPVRDTVTCKCCKKFYGDAGQTPKIYKLSTLLGNGTNYGKLKEDWQPVVGATHVNTRTSSIIEVRPGYAVDTDGKLYFIGRDKWKAWIVAHLEG